MRLTVLWLFCCILSYSARTEAQPVPAPFEPGTLRLELIPAKTSYALGDPIDITLRFSTDSAAELALDSAGLRQFGNYFLEAVDEKGKSVSPPYSPQPGDQTAVPPPGEVISVTRPFQQHLKANYWLAFEKPGLYRLRFGTQMRGQKTIESEPCPLVITPPDEAVRVARLQAASTLIRSASQTNFNSDTSSKADRPSRFEAVQGLNFMRDERTIPILVRALSDE